MTISTLSSVKEKSIAVASGKGGVGKTTTAANLALYYAKQNYRVALIDIDPLSDISTLFDVKESEDIFKEKQQRKAEGFKSEHMPLFNNLHLVFPGVKAGQTTSAELYDKIYSTYIEELNDKYDLLLFDMPAGNDEEDNLRFISNMHTLIVVTNPEPTSHVSAGNYIKNVIERGYTGYIRLWHNKYPGTPVSGFDPLDVIGNYNKNVSPDKQLNSKIAEAIQHAAYIPKDNSLDLLKGAPPVMLQVLYSIRETLQFILETQIQEHASALPFSPNMKDLVVRYTSRTQLPRQSEKAVKEIGSYLYSLYTGHFIKTEENSSEDKSGIQLFTSEENDVLVSFYRELFVDKAYIETNKTLTIVNNMITKKENAEGDFSNVNEGPTDKMVDRAISSVLLQVNTQNSKNTDALNYGSLLVFYFSLFKLFQSAKIQSVVSRFLPKRKNEQGKLIRDRYTQIRYLVSKSQEYKKRYFSLIKALFPIVSKQISNLVKTFELDNLIYREKHGEIRKDAYVKLFTHFLHDTLYSGLSIIVGFSYRSATVAFQEGAQHIISTLEQKEESA